MTYLNETLAYAVLASSAIPAHDETLDLVEEIGEKLTAFHAYIASVRSAGQADMALVELVDAIKSATYDLIREARHERQH